MMSQRIRKVCLNCKTLQLIYSEAKYCGLKCRNEARRKETDRVGGLTYVGAHRRVAADRGKASKCVICRKGAKFEWANLTGNLEDIEDYIEVCRQCHWRLDYRRVAIIFIPSSVLAILQPVNEHESDV